ncbi:hypothetical protein ROZALSC1DRAFT_24956 [Rozella allomycis CSF55]|uniref:AIG1-type G domain-containing protein n=1 Tax=Rozella allomycis (strain CSF55) TaxID=988480 RepID=A0A4P9YC92_ROZAC|nr:hypothetical protein ROZALSC1DRAFT_24956 [Rozella allomycis CSF55]
MKFPESGQDPGCSMKKYLLLGFLGFIVAPPVTNDACDRPLNLLMLGPYGAEKSKIINVLHGLCDLRPGDSRKIAYELEGCRQICRLYACGHNGISLQVVDTPEFEIEFENANNNIREIIHTEVPQRFRNGFDAFMLIWPWLNMRPSISRIKDAIDFIKTLITEEGFNRGFIVFTHSDYIRMDQKEENEEILRFKNDLLRVDPSTKNFLNSVKYLFFRNEFGKTGVARLGTSDVRRQFLDQVYSELFKLCKANSGNLLSPNEMRRAKEKYEDQKSEIEEYRRIRKELEESFVAIINQNEYISSDLKCKVDEIREMSPPPKFQNPGRQSQGETLLEEKAYHERTKTLRDSIHAYKFLQTQLKMMYKNNTALKDEFCMARQKYNIETSLFIRQTKKIKVVKFRLPYVPDKRSPSTINSILSRIQRAFDLAPNHYIIKYISRAGFDKDDFVFACFSSCILTFNDYLAQFELLKEKTAIVNDRIDEIGQLREEMRNAVHLVKDYEHKEKILKAWRILGFSPPVNQYILNQKVVFMNETQANENSG